MQRRNTENLKPWPKGVSGNPAGRPKSRRYLSEALREWLGAPNGENPEITNADVLAAKIGNSALNGNFEAIKFLAITAEGKPRPTEDFDYERKEKQLLAGLGV